MSFSFEWSQEFQDCNNISIQFKPIDRNLETVTDEIKLKEIITCSNTGKIKIYSCIQLNSELFSLFRK